MKLLNFIKFNEGTEIQLAQSIEDFCELNLAYLFDDSVGLVIEYKKNGIGVGIWINDDIDYIYWDSIKDRFIPFTIFLNNEFIILDNIFNFIREDYNQLSIGLNDISNIDNMKLKGIDFTITNKKAA